MKIWYFTPYSISKNLGAEYNAYMNLIPDGDSACLQDGDSMFLTPDFGHIIYEYANRNTNTVLTCWVNRIHELSRYQKYQWVGKDGDDVRTCISQAKQLRDNMLYETNPIQGSVSGTLLVIPKHIWKQFPFCEINTFRPNEPNLLGCDNEWTNRIRANGIQVLRMDGVLIYHQYRLLTGTKDHLL